MKVFFVWLVLLVLYDGPLRRSRISLTRLYCASCLDALSYHSLMVVGRVSLAKIFWRIPVLIPSMKYSVKALSSDIFAFPARIRNSATYSSTLLFPCLNCLSFALASPSVSAAEKAPLNSFVNASRVPKSGFAAASLSVTHASFHAKAVGSLGHVRQHEYYLLGIC